MIGCSQESPTKDSVTKDTTKEKDQNTYIPDPVAPSSVRVTPEDFDTDKKEYSQPTVNNNQSEKVMVKDVTICPLSDDDYSSQAMCLWREAMNQKSLEICNSLPEFSPNLNDDYLNASDCRNTLSYSHNGNVWNLTGGIPQLGDGGVAYDGRATLKGWFVQVPSYVDNPVAHFHVMDSSKQDLPFQMSDPTYKFSDFNLTFDNSEELIKSLETNSSENNPISIIVIKISHGREGTPRMTIEKIAQ